MDKKWVFITVILAILILVVSGELYLYFTNKQKNTTAQKATPALPLPDELAETFDPTVNSAVFSIDSVNSDDDVLNLDYAWPDSYASKKITVL